MKRFFNVLLLVLGVICTMCFAGCNDIMMGPNHSDSTAGPCLTFKGDKDFTLGFNPATTAKHWDGTLEWCNDKTGWVTVTDPTKDSISSKEDDGSHYIYLRGKGNTYFSSGQGVATVFQLTGNATTVECNGNIMTLLDYESPNDAKMDSKKTCFLGLFASCDKLTKAPELPATSLEQGCYANMFDGCTALSQAPVLPAKTLAYGCYQQMFNGCKNLKASPALPATTLAESCYRGMFQDCSSLTSVGKIAEGNAVTTVDYCFDEMFKDCTNLKVEEQTGAGDYFVHFGVVAGTDPIDDMFSGCAAASVIVIKNGTKIKTNP